MKYGFTIIESLLALTIAGAGAITLINQNAKEAQKNQALSFSNDIVTIINAVDHRISIDGYDPSLWTKTNWANENEIVNDLLGKELVSTGSHCSGGMWTPSILSELKTKLIPCQLWKQRKNIEVNMNAEIGIDSVGFIQNFDLIFTFSNQSSFEKYFLSTKNGLIKSQINTNKEISGLHTFETVSLSNTNNIITNTQCINDFSNCAFKASFNRSGGNEYMRADGGNSMIGEHITFIESKGQAPLKCIRWENTQRDGSGNWTQKPNEDCGIGIYNNSPVSIDAVADTGTFKNILLDKQCIVYEWNGSNVIDNGKRSPCGITNNGSVIYQTVQNTIAKTATFSEIRGDQAYIDKANINQLNVTIANIDEIITPLINTNALNVNGLLQVNGRAIFNNGDAQFGENIYVEKTSNLKGDLIVHEETTLIGDTNIEGVTNILNNLIVQDNINITNGKLSTNNIETNNISIGNNLKINNIKNINDSCVKNNESLAINSNGVLLSCQNGKWTEPEALFAPDTIYTGSGTLICIGINKPGYYIAYTNYGTSSLYVNNLNSITYGSSMTSSNSHIGVYYEPTVKQICGHGNHGTPRIIKLIWQHH